MNLKIFSLNCWLLPFHFSTDNKKRLSTIIFLIKKYKPNIIALQEVWLSKYAKKIEDELKDYLFIKSDCFYNKSGLMTGFLQKTVNIQNDCEKGSFPITGKHSLSERIAKKGYHIVQLNNDLFFVNAHLYAPMNSSGKSIVHSQFNFLQGLVRNEKCILAGDLNIDENELKHVNHVFVAPNEGDVTVSSANPLTWIRFNKAMKKDIKIDYILTTKKSNVSTASNVSITIKCIKQPIVSDHFPLTAFVRIS